MCGIFGYIGNKNTAADIVFEGIKTLEYRGYDSWGVAAKIADSTAKHGTIPRTHFFVQKKAGKIGNALLSCPASTCAIGHTRWATHGGVTENNAHPHIDCTGSIALIHNGIIENYETLKKHVATHSILSETDSEIALHLIEEEAKHNPIQQAVMNVFRMLEGCNALIVTCLQEEKIIAIKRGSPLVIGFGDYEQYIASDAPALLPHTQSVYYLEDNEMAVLEQESVAVYNTQTETKKTITPIHLTWSNNEVTKDGFDTFMEKEIHQQPCIIRHIAGREITDLKPILDAIQTAQSVAFVGCGSASYACIEATYLLSEIANIHSDAVLASEIAFKMPLFQSKTLSVCLSQSGETMDLIDAVKKIQSTQGSVAALVNVIESTLYRLADIKILTLAGPEIAVASTKDMTAKIAHLIRISYALANKDSRGIDILSQSADACDAILTKNSLAHIRSVATSITDATSVFVLGRGPMYPIALETALKIKEISYIHAEGMPAGELKHGPLALVQSKTPCIILMPDDKMYNSNLAAAMEMKARGGRIIAITNRPHSVMDEIIPIKSGGIEAILPTMIIGQLIGLYAAQAKQLDPDKPRNLAKSVTVK